MHQICFCLEQYLVLVLIYLDCMSFTRFLEEHQGLGMGDTQVFLLGSYDCLHCLLLTENFE